MHRFLAVTAAIFVGAITYPADAGIVQQNHNITFENDGDLTYSSFGLVKVEAKSLTSNGVTITVDINESLAGLGTMSDIHTFAFMSDFAGTAANLSINPTSVTVGCSKFGVAGQIDVPGLDGFLSNASPSVSLRLPSQFLCLLRSKDRPLLLPKRCLDSKTVETVGKQSTRS